MGKLGKSISQHNICKTSEVEEIRTPSGFKNVGLAKIASKIDMVSSYANEVFEMDEDDRMMDILAGVEESRKKLDNLAEIPPSLTPEPVVGSIFTPTRFSINLSPEKNDNISQYLTIGEWLTDLQQNP